MTYYYENEAEYASRGIDYDLAACLENNPQPFGVDDIEVVLAVWEGENDGDHWRWILKLKDNRFVFLEGWCDYTGWDCQSGASSEFEASPELCLKHASDKPDVYKSLIEQLTKGKDQTWREKMDDEFGLDK